MISAYLIIITYAFFGCAYAPGSDSLLAFLFISLSCFPILIAGIVEKKDTSMIFRKPGGLVYWTIILLGLFNLIVIAHSVNKGIGDLFSMQGITSIASDSTVRRYTEGGNSGNPLILSFSLLLLYIIGTVERFIPAWKKLLAFLPIILYTVITTEKAVLFFGCIFFLTGLFASNTDRVALGRALKYVVLFCLFGFFIIGVALVLRGFSAGISGGLEMVLNYLFAPYPAFGNWLYNNASVQCCTLGSLTFSGPLSAIGLTQRVSGVFVNNYVIYGLETNVYTGFRYLVQDFSIIGPFVFCLILSGFYSFTNFSGYRRLNQVIRTFTIFCALLSIACTPFVYNSILLSICMALSYSFLLNFFKFNWDFNKTGKTS